MPASFTRKQQEEIREQLFHEGIKLFRTLGVQRTTVSKLTSACGIAKGSFYSFYESKEAFILALITWAEQKKDEMLKEKFAGRSQMSAHEFLEFFREYLYSEYDLMNGLTVNDFLWLKTHMADADLFNPVDQMALAQKWLPLISDVRENVNCGMVVNLVKSIYAMREHRDTLVEASLADSIDLMLRVLEIYISGKGALL
ncbi:MAG: TetR/AcrR family transcriptional regulator [Lachnospiraceae bacterium]|nr:TetR/AcrR family transcriptional regulator [Lachnospiraceae bacterium]MCM1233657.1 TetR/AcrR family transcriptional regulator [Ruminococcus flavefaciens]